MSVTSRGFLGSQATAALQRIAFPWVASSSWRRPEGSFETERLERLERVDMERWNKRNMAVNSDSSVMAVMALIDGTTQSHNVEKIRKAHR